METSSAGLAGDRGTKDKDKGRKRLLIADDNLDIVETARTLFELHGFEVQEAHDGFAALDAFAAGNHDVVILDIGMPGMSGFDVARAIRQRPDGQAALLIAITGWGQQSDIERSQAAGFDYHFTKPADMGEICSVISARVGR